jgi:hypothetical protein
LEKVKNALYRFSSLLMRSPAGRASHYITSKLTAERILADRPRTRVYIPFSRIINYTKLYNDEKWRVNQSGASSTLVHGTNELRGVHTSNTRKFRVTLFQWTMPPCFVHTWRQVSLLCHMSGHASCYFSRRLPKTAINTVFSPRVLNGILTKTDSLAQEPEGLSPHPQQPETGSYPEAVESNPHPKAISPISILIPSSHLCLGLPSGLFPSGFPTKTLYNFLYVAWNDSDGTTSWNHVSVR